MCGRGVYSREGGGPDEERKIGEGVRVSRETSDSWVRKVEGCRLAGCGRHTLGRISGGLKIDSV